MSVRSFISLWKIPGAIRMFQQRAENPNTNISPKYNCWERNDQKKDARTEQFRIGNDIGNFIFASYALYILALFI